MCAIEIRPGEEGDLPALTTLYNYYVENTPITFDVEPYTVEGRGAWFRQFGATGPHRLLVALKGGVVAGYASTSTYGTKAAYATTVETSIYVATDCRGDGIGSKLYEALFESISGEDVHRALGGITLPNEASVALHHRFGFSLVGTFSEVGHKFGKYWDAAWYEKVLE